jgi:hypothetical protein
MQLLARMMAFLSFLVMVNYANAAGNSVYVDQIGDGSTISITQTGNTNSIGNATNKATFNGQNNIVTIDQIGNTNVANVTVFGDGVTVNSLVTGDNNAVGISCGAGGSCSGSSLVNTITGDNNTVTQNAEGFTLSTVTINSDNNTVNIQNDSSSVAGAKSTVLIDGGGGNDVAIKQTGVAGLNGHDADVNILGATNTVDIKQGGGVDSKVISTITGSGNTLTIKSNHN